MEPTSASHSLTTPRGKVRAAHGDASTSRTKRVSPYLWYGTVAYGSTTHRIPIMGLHTPYKTARRKDVLMAEFITDVAAFILNRTGTITTMKLHKLAYYAQAAHIVAHGGTPLFPEDFYA